MLWNFALVSTQQQKTLPAHTNFSIGIILQYFYYCNFFFFFSLVHSNGVSSKPQEPKPKTEILPCQLHSLIFSHLSSPQPTALRTFKTVDLRSYITRRNKTPDLLPLIKSQTTHTHLPLSTNKTTFPSEQMFFLNPPYCSNTIPKVHSVSDKTLLNAQVSLQAAWE